MPRVFFALWLILSAAAMAGAQQSSDPPPAQQPVVAGVAAEYADYMTAINTVDAAGRQAALNDFVRRYPDSVLRNQAAYTLANNTDDPVARLAALDDFVWQYPDSPLRAKAEEMYTASLIFLEQPDAQRPTAPRNCARPLDVDGAHRMGARLRAWPGDEEARRSQALGAMRTGNVRHGGIP